jgi:hypothetical protein
MPCPCLLERFVALILLAASVLSVAACSADEGGCPLILAADATVTVTDADTGAPVCGADVTLSVDGETFVAEESDLTCGGYTVWSAELDRDLQLLVEAEGYRSYVTFIRVPKGQCGPMTQHVDVELNPN